MFFSDDVPLPEDAGIIPDISLGSSNYAQDSTINPSVLQQPIALHHSNEQNIRDEDFSFTLPLSSSSSSYNQNLGEEHCLWGASDFSLGLPDAFPQLLPAETSSETSSTEPASLPRPFSFQNFYTQAQSSSVTSASSPKAQDNTSSSGLARPASVDLPPAKKRIQSSTTFHCAICGQKFGTSAIYERHTRNHRRYPCEMMGCDKVFTTSRGRQRHYETTIHRSPRETRFYCCQCGKKDPRKDNHKRHILSCHKDRRDDYCCSCGVFTNAKEEHLAHTVMCGAHNKRAGTDAINSDAMSRERLR